MKAATILAVLAFAASSVSAEPVHKGRVVITSCGFRGNSCHKARDAAPEAVAEPAPEADAEARRRGRVVITSCGFRGNPCHKTRDADPEADPEARRRGRVIITSCGFPGNPCHKAKRAALAVAEALAEPRRRGRVVITSCGFRGNPCHKARRSLEEISDLTEDILDKALWVDEDETALAKRDELVPQLPDPADYEDVEAEDSDAEPTEEDIVKYKHECFSEGGECSTLENAHDAFHSVVKREARRRGRVTITSCGFPGNSCARDVAELEQEKQAGNPEVLKAEEDCYAPDGECTAAEAYLAKLETALNDATNATYA